MKSKFKYNVAGLLESTAPYDYKMYATLITTQPKYPIERTVKLNDF